jgi:hypothetical protein
VVNEHIPIDRAWILIEGSSPLSGKEGKHLETCEDCREFLRSFVSVAKFVGFSVHFPNRDDGTGECVA